jgi:DNA polymerase III subunit gamma/tau
MPIRLPSLSRVAIRTLEIAGAGLTSAVVAFLLGRVDTPAPAPPPLPAVVHLAPADEEMIRSVRNDQAALLEQLRNDSQPRKAQVASQAASVVQVPPPTVAAPAVAPPTVASPAVASPTVAPPWPADVPTPSVVAKPVKSAQAAVRRDHKPERVRVADSKLRVEPASEQPLQIQPAVTVSTEPAAGNPGQRGFVVAPGVASAPAPESDSHLTSTFKQITAWILPSRDRAPENVPANSVPRPPKPVGEFLQSDM